MHKSVFSAQILLSIVTVAMCIYKLTTSTDAATASIYLPVLTGVTSTWLPSPSGLRGSVPPTIVGDNHV